jgi:hypothetical protein
VARNFTSSNFGTKEKSYIVISRYVKPDVPFGVKSMVASVVTWSVGSRLVHVCVG